MEVEKKEQHSTAMIFDKTMHDIMYQPVLNFEQQQRDLMNLA